MTLAREKPSPTELCHARSEAATFQVDAETAYTLSRLALCEAHRREARRLLEGGNDGPPE